MLVGVCLEECAWRSVLGGVWLDECDWRIVLGGVCLDECAWMSVLGGVCLDWSVWIACCRCLLCDFHGKISVYWHLLYSQSCKSTVGEKLNLQNAWALPN